MMWNSADLFCNDLPTRPLPELGKILVTGATGYIGGRLVPELLERGYQVRVMVRKESPELTELWPEAELVVADALDIDSLTRALDGIHAAYYLIHSLLLGREKFAVADSKAAINFTKAAEKNQVKRIIYLGGLGNDDQSPLSPHLKSRLKVARVMMQGAVPTTFLRAAIIIGSGSASYEIIRHLVYNCPLILVPKWGSTKCQPIAIRDVIKYLVGVLEKPEETAGKVFDIGGSDVLSYEMMLKTLAGTYFKKRLFIHFPVANTKLYAYILSLLTPVPAAITLCLMESCCNDVVCQNDTIKSIIPFQPISYTEALRRALSREERDIVETRWSDAFPPAHELAVRLHELKKPPEYSCSYSLTTAKAPALLFNIITRVGGK